MRFQEEPPWLAALRCGGPVAGENKAMVRCCSLRRLWASEWRWPARPAYKERNGTGGRRWRGVVEAAREGVALPVLNWNERATRWRRWQAQACWAVVGGLTAARGLGGNCKREGGRSELDRTRSSRLPALDGCRQRQAGWDVVAWWQG
jgi:hypothetical protein